MWSGLQEYIACGLVLTSPAGPRMSDSSNFEFSWCVVGGRTAAVLWGVSSWIFQYCSQHSCVIAVKLFLRHFVIVYSVYPYSNINTTAARKNWVLFYRSGLNSIWLIVYRLLSMSLLVSCWCLFLLMRRNFRGGGLVN